MYPQITNMKVLFVAWQDPASRNWQPVARLTFENTRFRFVYTKGAKSANNFMPFGRMTDIYDVYESKELFPLFTNRLLSKNRPEYREFLEWLNIEKGEDDPLVVLGRSGGKRGTDSLMIFPCPERTPDGKYQLYFFSQGLRYLKKEDLDVIAELKIGAQLFLMLDVQNQHDHLAIALRKEDPPVLLGYVPRYFAEDFQHLLKFNNGKSVKVVVNRVNQDAPVQLRLLCKISADWPVDLKSCSGELYQPLPNLTEYDSLDNKVSTSR